MQKQKFTTNNVFKMGYLHFAIISW